MTPVEYISGFSRLGKRVSDLSRIGSLLEAVGRPQDSLRFIHIAGTNGKGSMAQMFSEILVSGGYRTGLFTSPYIFTFNDRIRLDNSCIPDSELAEVISDIAPAIDAHPLRDSFSQFEVTQAAAFVWYARKKCDVVVLEAGLGGLLDSTNIIESPLVCAIGSIALDHTDILGDTVEQIAVQKAGIIKPGSPCVLSAGAPAGAVRVFRETAAEKGSLLNIPNYALCRVTRSDITGSTFSYRGEEFELTMPGLHQVNNALTVIDSLRLIGDRLPVSGSSIKRGLAAAKLPGRVDVLSKDPLIILDGSHNPDGMAALAGTLKAGGCTSVRAVIGMHSDKNAAEAASKLLPCTERFYPVSGFSDRDIPAEKLAEMIESSGGRTEVRSGEIAGVIRALAEEYPGDVLLICGSLYLVSYVKEHQATIINNYRH